MRKQRDFRDSKLITVSDQDLVTNPGLVAYEDGYADAREQGKSGYLPDAKYSVEQCLRYQAGFTKGLRIYRIRLNEEVTSPSQRLA